MFDLLKILISIPSVSRDEKAKADFLEAWLQEKGCAVQRLGNNIWCVAEGYDASKPTILLNSHIDTVKPTTSWSRDPYKVTEENGRIYGLGSNDAHASVVSLIFTFLKLKDTKQSYNLVLLLSAEEEVSGKNGIESVLDKLPKIDFAIVGEPTSLKMAVAEKGLMVLDCESKGKSGHAARNEGVNAIYKAMDEIKWFQTYRFPNKSEWLGPVNMQVTIVNAGTQHNVVPDKCTFTVDVRLNECYTHQDILNIIEANVQCSVTPRSTRLKPSGISVEHPAVQKFKAMGGELFGSSTMSDQALMPFPSVKLGPGDSARSHTADEYICIDEIISAENIYFKLLDGLKL
ncbi:MAG: M20 family metallo-hydrolase [Paludibacteraceae bacterium]|nr:M20 family metallo-hydrolase [Paludibacteraceae bacterium]